LEKMPVLFVGHGSPMNAIEHNAFTEALQSLSARLPKPKAVCVVSAHWVTEGAHVMSSAHSKTFHDFYGFPRPLYEVQYPAHRAPSEAKKLASNPEIAFCWMTSGDWITGRGACCGICIRTRTYRPFS
jgi:4,5-DOPA dioxygenase extradiol